MNSVLKILVGDILATAQCPNKNQAHKEYDIADLINAYVANYVEQITNLDEELVKKRKAN